MITEIKLNGLMENEDKKISPVYNLQICAEHAYQWVDVVKRGLLRLKFSSSQPIQCCIVDNHHMI